MSSKKEEIEINILKEKLESLEHRVKFLESNWVSWIASSQDIGQKLIIALEGKLKDAKLS